MDPLEESRDTLNTSPPTLAENYTLADGPPKHINCYFEMKCTDCDILIFNCHHFAIHCLHKYVHFTVYGLFLRYCTAFSQNMF